VLRTPLPTTTGGRSYSSIARGGGQVHWNMNVDIVIVGHVGRKVKFHSFRNYMKDFCSVILEWGIL